MLLQLLLMVLHLVVALGHDDAPDVDLAPPEARLAPHVDPAEREREKEEREKEERE
jgi:hypothetical protein